MTYQTPEIVEMGNADELIQATIGPSNLEMDPWVFKNYQTLVYSEDEE